MGYIRGNVGFFRLCEKNPKEKTDMPRSSRALLFAFSPLLFAVGCGQQGGPPHGGGMPPAVVAVQGGKPHAGPLEPEYPPQTPRVREGEVRAPVDSILTESQFSPGAPLMPGPI